jgi:hypothetical protein
MGHIKPEVRNGHLIQFPQEEALLKPFLVGFDVNWGGRRRAYSTEVSAYFLGPERFMSEMFGFEHEVLLLLASYPTLEPRTMQAAEKVIEDEPAKGRVDQSIFFLATEAPKGREWMNEYTSRNPQSRIPVVFQFNDLIEGATDSWFVRGILRKQLFSRDLFDYQLPLDDDLFFFGRDAIVADHLDAIRRSQNRGLFGLRKTGKTSILYKLKRLVEREQSGVFLYYDCKLPSIRMLRWHELLTRVVENIASAFNLNKPKGLGDERRISDALMDVLKRTPTDKTVALVFDEIEYVSPLAIDDPHWHKDFVPFWQTLWAAQSQIRRLSNTIAGVNPTVVETDIFGGIQNPMFGIIQHRYLQGLAPVEMRSMVRFFGKRMGLSFTLDAFEYLHERYGGHPLLTRLACSQVHTEMERRGDQRPVEVSRTDLEKTEDARDAELVFYCRHVVSELRRFYPDEFELLEMLVSGQVVDAMDLSSELEYSRHLKEYGLLTINSVRRPILAIPVIGKFVASEVARREGRRSPKHVVAIEDRPGWIKRRGDAVTREFRELSRLITKKSLPPLFLGGDFPEADRFAAIQHVSTNNDFVNFINVCNRCFVEAVEVCGRRQAKSDYFWKEIKATYPDLWQSLQRIKTYRNRVATVHRRRP